jgi:hypothetical protein
MFDVLVCKDCGFTAPQRLPDQRFSHTLKTTSITVLPERNPQGPVRSDPARRRHLHRYRHRPHSSQSVTPTLGMALMALTGRRPAEIFFSAKFSLPEKKLPFPALIFSGQLKTRNAPGTSFAPHPILVLAAPKRVLAAFERLRSNPYLPGYPTRPYRHQGRPQ